MKLPRVTATTPPPRETGLVRAQDIGALTNIGDAEFRAIQQLGGALKGTAGMMFKIQQQKQKISDDTQTDRISQNMKIWVGAQEEALKTTRIETPKDQEEYLARLTKGFDEMVGLELKGTSTGVQRNVKGLS